MSQKALKQSYRIVKSQNTEEEKKNKKFFSSYDKVSKTGSCLILWIPKLELKKFTSKTCKYFEAHHVSPPPVDFEKSRIIF